MALEKQGLNIPFGQGLDLKTDPNQVAAGKMLGLSNVVFDNGAQLHKRNGFPLLSTLPVTTNSVLTTHNGNLISTGSSLYAYAAPNDSWINRGTIQPVSILTESLVRASSAQSQASSAVASNGLTCTAYVDSAASLAYYQISDHDEVIVGRTALPSTSTVPKVFLFGNYFIITFVITSTYNLQMIAIPITAPNLPTSAVTMASDIDNSSAYDCVVANGYMYFAYDADDVGDAVRINVMDVNATINTGSPVTGTAKVIAGAIGGAIKITADTSGALPVAWVAYWDSGTSNVRASAYNLGTGGSIVSTPVLAATTVVNVANLTYLAISATDSTCTVFYNSTNNYSFVSVNTYFTSKKTINTAGTVSSATVIRRGVGIASKPFYVNDVGYLFVSAISSLQPTYFLINFSGDIIAKLAYSNAAQMETYDVTVINDTVYFTYLIKDFVASINTTQTASQNPVQPTGGLYSQTGINLATITINDSQQHSSEIGKSLHLTGGQLWQYDGVTPVEHSFHLFPEDLFATKANSSGTLINQQYYYIAVYEWTDNNGLLHRSAPSLPCGMLLSGAEDTITVNVPTLRVTSKPSSNPVRIVLYRWSTAQPIYYQVTSITSPVLNDVTADSVAFVDTLPDTSIVGNTILYTTGGVIENIAAPASFASTLYKSRLFVADAENRNLIWYSKQVIEATPVEMSDLFTIYVAPTAGAQGSTGNITALSSMDDKLIIFKKDAIYYVTGTGPDNTGANNDFSEPVYITGTAGCENQASIIQTPQGIMFQSDKGIWLLGRDLSTSYIGAPMESYNTSVVVSGLTIPATNQVRFTLDSGVVLMYDYYFAQWSTFSGIPGISSCLYNGLHTYLNQYGQIMQEDLSSALDYAAPVTISFTTAWLKLTNLQGFQRAYFFYLLGTYVSPHKLNISIAYDYDPAVKQTVVYTPPNSITKYGDAPIYGSGVYGGEGNAVEQFRVFLKQQKCQAVQITVQESYDPSKGVPAGGGLNLSGINFVVGAKKGHPVLPASKSVG